MRVPAALSVARALDTLTVTIDPETLGQTQLTTHAGTFLGIEADIAVFAQGRPEPLLQSHRVWSTTDFNECTASWSTARDGLPAQGTQYVVEMKLVLFATDAPPARAWTPHAGAFDALWTRTLRQAEE